MPTDSLMLSSNSLHHHSQRTELIHSSSGTANVAEVVLELSLVDTIVHNTAAVKDLIHLIGLEKEVHFTTL